MDIVHGLGTVGIVAICLILYPLFWLLDHPILMGLLTVAAVAGIIALNVKHTDEKREAEEKRKAEIEADPFKAVDPEAIERWNGYRSWRKDEADWQKCRKSIIQQLKDSIEYNERQRDDWAQTSKRMAASYQKKVDDRKLELEWWQDGGIFDKPLSWGSYKFE